MCQKWMCLKNEERLFQITKEIVDWSRKLPGLHQIRRGVNSQEQLSNSATQSGR